MIPRSGLALALASGLVAGCAGPGTAQTSTTPSRVAQAQASHEYRSSPPPTETWVAGAVSPVEAIRAFANSYINWTADSVAADMQQLAGESIGQARSAVQLAAAETANDYELQRGGIANGGTVEAVAPLLGHRDQYAVVTRELTTATGTTAYQGLRPAWHITIATVAEQAPGQWVVSGWQPQA